MGGAGLAERGGGSGVVGLKSGIGVRGSEPADLEPTDLESSELESGIGVHLDPGLESAALGASDLGSVDLESD